jgi:hypothetical protein
MITWGTFKLRKRNFDFICEALEGMHRMEMVHIYGNPKLRKLRHESNHRPPKP